jgi:hypothetical protein
MAQAQVTTGRCRQVAGWSSLIAAALLLASLFNAGVTSGSGGIEQTAPTGMVPAQGTPDAHYGPGGQCQLIVRPPLYAGQNTWVTQTTWQCPDPLP